ncbi:MAG: calcium-binding protein [Actinomycetota bacterium]
MSQGRRAGLLCGAAAALALAFPAAGGAAVTIGEDTSIPGGDTFECDPGPSCTLVQSQHGTRPVVAPFDGVIVRWRMRAVVTGNFKLRVVRPLGGNLFTGAGASADTPVVSGGERTLNTRLPVRAGDQIGVDIPGTGAAIERRGAAGGLVNQFTPTLFDNEMPARAPDGSFPEALVLNADIEPDCDRDGLGDESQDFDLLACNPPLCAGRTPTIVGTLGNDNLTGTPGPDVIQVSIGDDKVEAGAGNDIVCGGKNKDRLAGGTGKDLLLGELGKDVLLGEGGRDRLKGQGGKDKCKGGPGRDRGSSCERTHSVERTRSLP